MGPVARMCRPDSEAGGAILAILPPSLYCWLLAPHLLEQYVTDTSVGPPRVLAARYEIERELGQGGMATVYHAHDLVRGSRVALKLVRPAGAGARPRALRTGNPHLSHLHHPNILPELDTGIGVGLPFYVMPFVEGESLAGLIHPRQRKPNDRNGRARLSDRAHAPTARG
jgi:serine/threonine protein kinase